MSVAKNDTLYKRVKARGLDLTHVAEVGVHEPESSNVYGFIQDGVRTTLIEPEPEALAAIKTHFSGMEHITLHECAVCDFDGEIELYKRGPSTFVGQLPSSPAMINDAYEPDAKDKFSVKATKFDQIDDGSIELLSIDTEGSEWYVIQNLVSRPKVISVEMHGGAYMNPYTSEINAWMKEQGYVVWYKGKTDSVYAREADLAPSMGDRLALMLMDFRICLRRTRKRLGA